MSALTAPQPNSPDKVTHDWAVIATRAPRLAATLGRYLTQASTLLAPRSIDAASIALRQFAFWLLEHTDVTAVAAISRTDVEDFTVWLADQPGLGGGALSTNTRSQRPVHEEGWSSGVGDAPASALTRSSVLPATAKSRERH